jgi:hypothetical protein
MLIRSCSGATRQRPLETQNAGVRLCRPLFEYGQVKPNSGYGRDN